MQRGHWAGLLPWGLCTRQGQRSASSKRVLWSRVVPRRSQWVACIVAWCCDVLPAATCQVLPLHWMWGRLAACARRLTVSVVLKWNKGHPVLRPGPTSQAGEPRCPGALLQNCCLKVCQPVQHCPAGCAATCKHTVAFCKVVCIYVFGSQCNTFVQQMGYWYSGVRGAPCWWVTWYRHGTELGLFASGSDVSPGCSGVHSSP